MSETPTNTILARCPVCGALHKNPILHKNLAVCTKTPDRIPLAYYESHYDERQ